VPAGSRATLENYGFIKDLVVDPGKNAIVAELAKVAGDLDCSVAQLSLAWCLKNPAVSTVITGASRPTQVVENMLAAQVVTKLGEDVMTRIESIFKDRFD